MSLRPRLFGAALLPLTALIALSGCSTNPGTSTATAGSQTLTITSDNPVPLKAAIAVFEKQNPSVTVQFADGGSNYPEFVRTRLAAGNAPDVIRTFPGRSSSVGVSPLFKAGLLKDLSSASWTSSLSDVQKSLFGDNGKILSVPMSTLALGPVYNDQTLKSLGVSAPTTLDEVFSLCQKAKAAGKVAYTLFLKGGSPIPSYAFVAPLVYGPNPTFTQQQESGSTSFAKSGWVSSFALQQRMAKAGCFNKGPTGTDYSASFAQVAKGSAVATFAFSDTSGLEQVSPKGTTFTLVPMPTDNNADSRVLSAADASGFGVNAKAKNVALAEKFVAFLASDAAQNAYATAAKGAPSIPNDTFKPSNKNQETIVQYQKEKRIATWPDQGWPGTGTSLALATVSQGIFLGQDTPQQAAAAMDQAFAKDLAAAK